MDSCLFETLGRLLLVSPTLGHELVWLKNGIFSKLLKIMMNWVCDDVSSGVNYAHYRMMESNSGAMGGVYCHPRIAKE